MKLFLLLLFLFMNTDGPSTTVYVCRSAKGKKYHLRTDCRGLSNCKHKIDKMRLEQARKSGLTLCGWEK
jgi:hypothetical protein